MTLSPRLRWGILGTGGIAHSFTSDLIGDGGTVTAVGSRTAGSAAAFAETFAIPAAHGSYAELVADDDVDVIYVATPHMFHEEHALLAIEAGKHVLVEKAFTMNAAQARRLFERAAEKNVVVIEAMWTRFLPQMIRLRELIAAGEIGELRAVIADHTQSITADPAHRLNAPELGGGALLDLGVYPVSFVQDMLGTPSSVQATATYASTGVDETVAVAFGYEGRAVASVTFSSRAKGPNTASVIGTLGRVELDPVWYCPSGFRRYTVENELVETFDGSVEGRGMYFEARELERVVAAGETEAPEMSHAGSIVVMEMMDSIREIIGVSYDGE